MHENHPESQKVIQLFLRSHMSHTKQHNTYSSLLHSQLADVYGNVFCIRLGRHKTVFVSGWKMVKEALVTQADNFADRPYSPMVTRIYSGNSGQHRTNRTDEPPQRGSILARTWVKFGSHFLQQVFSSVTGRCGGDNDVSP